MSRTAKQITASRNNGAKSSGPVSIEGKQRSSLNGLKYGLNSKVVVLHNESKEGYAQLTAEYMDHYQPATAPERDLVNDIVAARWRLNRVMAMETAALDLEMDRQRDAVAKEFESTDEATRCALAYEKLADNGRFLAMLSRHEARLRRAIEKASERLEQLQSARKSAKTQICQSEPKPAPTPPPSPTDRRPRPTSPTSDIIQKRPYE